jgi:hypothetical protein
MFLAGAIERYTTGPGEKMPAEDLKIKIVSWPDFKDSIFDIYDHRIHNAPEI